MLCIEKIHILNPNLIDSYTNVAISLYYGDDFNNSINKYTFGEQCIRTNISKENVYCKRN